MKKKPLKLFDLKVCTENACETPEKNSHLSYEIEYANIKRSQENQCDSVYEYWAGVFGQILFHSRVTSSSIDRIKQK